MPLESLVQIMLKVPTILSIIIHLLHHHYHKWLSFWVIDKLPFTFSHHLYGRLLLNYLPLGVQWINCFIAILFTIIIKLTHWGRGHLNCLNARSRGLNNLNQLLYCVSLRCVIPVVCVTKWEGGVYSRTTQLIRRKYGLFYYEKTTRFGLHWPSSGFIPIKGVSI